MSWYNNDSAFQSQYDDKPFIRRFWMPNNSEKMITFVDGPTVMCGGTEIKTPFQYQEYQVQHNGNWRNWFTRHPDPSHDVLSQHGHKAAKVAAFTIIDHSEYTDKQGNVHKDKISLYVVKRSQPIYKQIEKLLARHGNLQGKSFNVYRMGDKSPGCGSMLEPIDSWPGFDPSVHVSFNYLDVLAPKSADEISEALGLGGQQAGGDHQWGEASPQLQKPQWGPSSTSQQQPQQPQQPKSTWAQGGNSGMPF
jgi:hypothetical protein